jgi:hypothetical protein
VDRPGRLAAAGLVLVAVIAAVVYVVSRSGQAGGEPQDEVVPQAATLTVDTEPEVRLDGDRLVLQLPLTNPGARGLQVLDVRALPAGFASLLPDEGLAVPAGSSAGLALGWQGPDCGGDAPEHLLPDLALVVRLDGEDAGVDEQVTPTDLTVDTGTADELLLRARQSACADQPAPTPGNEVTDGRR